MTTETKVMISPDDIVGVQFECMVCSGKTTIPTTSKAPMHVPAQCSLCKEVWFPNDARDPRHRIVVSAVEQLSQIARAVREMKESGVKLAVRFELGAESVSSARASRDKD